MGYLNSINRRGGYATNRARGGFISAWAGGVIKRTLSGLQRKGAAALAPAAAPLGFGPLVPPPGMKPTPGLKGKIQRALPGGHTGFFKRRRMNVANPKALRRAIRRTDGFVKLARRTLKGTGFVVTRRGLSKAARPRKR